MTCPNLARTLRSAMLAAAALQSGCLLPGFEEASDRDAGSSQAVEFCGLSGTVSASCSACIEQECCAQATACADDKQCASEFARQIAPTQSFDDAFDPMLRCMHSNCNEACNVSWGCVGDYRLPVPEASYSFTIDTVDYASDTLQINGVEVMACRGVDPGCVNGRADMGVSADGQVALTVPRDFDGFFAFSGGSFQGAPYLPAKVQWSEPIYRFTDFTHFMLNDPALSYLALATNYHQSAQQPFDETRGHLIVRVQGCLPMRFLNNPGPPRAEAAGVVIEAAPSAGASRFFYTDASGNVSSTLTATTTDGVGGAFDLPPGNITVTAKRADTGEVVARTTMTLGAGELGFAYLVARAQR